MVPADHPHRSAEFVERCRDCGEEAIGTCERCERHWCDEHSSGDLELCAGCESQWLEVRRDVMRVYSKPFLERRTIWLPYFLLVGATFISLILGWGWPTVVMLTALTTGPFVFDQVTKGRAFVEWTRGRALQRSRARFLDGRAVPQLPAADDSGAGPSQARRA